MPDATDILDTRAYVKSGAVDRGITERISVLETLQATTSQSLRSNASALNRLGEAIEKVDEKLDTVGKPQWNTLASWAGVIIVFIGMIGGSVLGNVISNQSRIESLLTNHVQHYQSYIASTAEIDGRQSQKIDNIELVIERLRDTHVKDFDLLNANARRNYDANTTSHTNMHKDFRDEVMAASERLDTRMQRELNDRVNPLASRIDAIEERATQRFNWLEERLYDKLRETPSK